ncbi:hypothetical protein HS088_TW09G01484 [Tripterygium wilfordii]|uniref:DNA topoisomerase n=1 Tax=Tripterygium wilfordii TaxID=458696 RepID=A0A7J7DAL3_TRIWF|nr:DNA topoisomerase 1 [Tripterygium wilfordii]XP_038711148.1 DNA topoisomerase 1 [Tripterygium wilfordii]XP_038711149.1 DNA topoisomerase 1 [Tripterygium wilfordii]KAF5743415.1 hypothetical protein HS088_TW09G01484 [Tripterygium wilfordii]
MTQMHRGLSFVSSSCSVFPPSTSRFDLFTAKCRALQNHRGPQLQCASFGFFDKNNKFLQLRINKVTVSSINTTNCPTNGDNLYHLPILSNGRKYVVTVQSCSKFVYLSRTSHGPTYGPWSLDSGIGFSSLNCRAFRKRLFSQSPSVTSKNESVGVRDGNTLAFNGSYKHWNKAKGLTAHAKTRSANSGLCAAKDVEITTSDEPLVGEPKEAGKLEASISTSVRNSTESSQVKGNKKQRSTSKKKKEKPSAALIFEESPVAKDSKSATQTKSSTVSKSGQRATRSSEKIVAAKTLVKVADGSAPTKKQSSKKSGNSSRKGKSVKAVNGSLQKWCPQEISNVKSGQRPLKQLFPPTGKSVVVVESVTKAKVIQGYLGDIYEVLPSYGHVRDLAARSGSVRPDDDFSMVWEVPSAAWTHLKSIKVALSGAENLILASDPDREGEAIAWHIVEMLQQQDALREDINVARVVFHEITEVSIKNALQNPREVDVNLVQAYLARRALDYLIGFNISPLLWRKLPGCQSAGRVQSAALALICDREMEVDEFKPQQYWTIEAGFNQEAAGSLRNAFTFPSHLTHFDSEKLNQFSISSDKEANDAKQKINSTRFQVNGSKKNMLRKTPPTPYITSTLQQDAANKLHFSATYTMKLSQKLYEGVQLSDGKAVGLITYMRTDGLHIADQAVGDIRSLVNERYGPNYTSDTARKYFKKVKNAQEAHEAIRPTDIWRLPSMLIGLLDEDSLKLYALIWSRTVACQMEASTIEQIQVDIRNAGDSIAFRSACSRVAFLGYQAVYEDVEAGAIRQKENERKSREEAFAILNSLKAGDSLCLIEVKPKQHFTQPPPHYSEGTLVKKLEELGIGRPSTYATTMKVLQDRNYVTVKNRVLYPEFRGRMVSAFLAHHFSEVMDYSFTADMETELDNVSAGLTEWKGLLRDYWTRFSSYCSRTDKVHIHQVEKMLEKTFGSFLFASLPDNSRTCPSCMEGTLIFKVSRFGAGYFIGCDQHPRCKYIAKTLYGDEEEEETPQNNNSSVEEPKLLGVHTMSNEKIFLKNGPYGFYVQLGEDRKGYIPKRASVSHIKDVDSITVDDAIELLRYPVTLGNHPKDGHPVLLKLAKVGFSVRHRRTIASVPKSVKPNDVTLEKALELLSSTDVRRCGRPKGKPKIEEPLEA